MPIEDRFPDTTAKRLDGGLVTRIPAHALQSHQSPDAQNFDPSEVGACKKRKGFIKFTSPAKVTPTGTFVSGLCAAATSGGTAYVLATEGTALHNITGGTWGTTISGATITVDTMVRMFMFNDIFVICNAGGGPYKWTGSGAAASLGGSPPANATGGGVHRSRVFLYKGTSVLSFSALSDPEDYTSTDNAGSITINKGDGFVVNGFMSGGDFAVVSKIAPSSGGKEGALYALFGSSPFDFNVKKIASVGAFGQEAMVQYDNMVFVATNRGIFGINGRNWARIDDPIFPTYDAITTKSTVALGRYGKTLRMAYTNPGSSTNDREFIYDVERGVWGKNTGKTNRIYANHPDGRILMGTSGTSILVWEDENGSNDDGAAIDFYWKTPEIQQGHPYTAKRLHAAHFEVSNNITTTLSLDQITDGSSLSWGQTMSTSTDFPSKRFAGKATAGKGHQLKIADNSTNGQTTLYGYGAYIEELQALP